MEESCHLIIILRSKGIFCFPYKKLEFSVEMVGVLDCEQSEDVKMKWFLYDDRIFKILNEAKNDELIGWLFRLN